MLDLGDVYTARVLITDDAGALANATTVTLTITKPDGTAATISNPIVASPTGVYTYAYTPTAVGHHEVDWVATGTNACAYSDEFDVYDFGKAGVSLADARAHLNFHGVTAANDEELRGFILTATRIVESVIGPIATTTYTEIVRDGADILALSHAPVLSVTSITSYAGATIDVSTLAADFTSGLVRFATPGPYFTTPATVVYKVGRTSVPPEVRTAILDLVRINWRPQQGGNRSAFDEATEAGPGSYELGFFVPNGVIGTLRTEALPGAVA